MLPRGHNRRWETGLYCAMQISSDSDEMIDAPLAGLDQQELITIPRVTEHRGLAEVRRWPPRSRSQPLKEGGRSVSDATGATEDKPNVSARAAWSGAGINLMTGN